MVCLDSDFLVAFLRGYPEAGKKMAELVQLGTHLTTTPVNSYELYHEAHASLRRTENLDKVRALLEELYIIPLDDPSCDEAGRTRAVLESQRTRIGDADSLIAGTALKHGETIVTRNVKHFSKVEGLLVERW